MEIRKNTSGYKILTDKGFVDFEGISKLPPKKLYNVYFKNGFYISATLDHEIFITPDICRPISELNTGDFVLTKHGKLQIDRLEYIGEEEVYDVLEVDGHKFYANDVLVHNCRFIGKSKTLIKSDTIRLLLDETSKKSYEYVVDEDVRFYKSLNRYSKYIVALDPSMGVSGDFAAIQIFEFPSFEQVGEWQSDSVNQNEQIEKIKTICEWMYADLRNKGAIKPEIYWTFENNTVGEGIIAALREKSTMDASIDRYISSATLLTQTGNKRLGWTTNKRNKTASCTFLKTRLEERTMIVNSRLYVQQLSNYTLKEVKIEASSGNHDDLISASLLVIMAYMQESGNLGLEGVKEKSYGDTPDEILAEWLGDYYNLPVIKGGLL